MCCTSACFTGSASTLSFFAREKMEREKMRIRDGFFPSRVLPLKPAAPPSAAVPLSATEAADAASST
eukprot:CAMPEP_0182945646 /NCGR_PEP_ID=MMETSP0105_2-20130417/55830_1 /TAXON_ID=81532 ORGANISM="Acanthoeca-like sp., Strain 10tr" /NCGR_SAMPLE_ID=MMETSP0105_2 /ASSEMBLY_ACC=CAM_ASM_000205 /LENGTH=66 /DNA_ID=CAMNT_0025085691 /DNA_START=27 /DNA_END=224 /DNA_ORIENTATION=-